MEEMNRKKVSVYSEGAAGGLKRPLTLVKRVGGWREKGRGGEIYIIAGRLRRS